MILKCSGPEITFFGWPEKRLVNTLTLLDNLPVTLQLFQEDKQNVICFLNTVVSFFYKKITILTKYFVKILRVERLAFGSFHIKSSKKIAKVHGGPQIWLIFGMEL